MEQINQSQQKRKYSKIAIAGFVLAILSVVFLGIFLPFTPRTISPFVVSIIFFILLLLSAFFSGIGIIICNKKSLKGKNFARIGMAIIFIFFALLILYFLFVIIFQLLGPF